MTENNRFSSQIDTGFGEKKVSQKVSHEEFHVPHHALTPFQKFITVVELVLTGWLVYKIIKVIISNIVYLGHVI
jgi:hypothetical protein